MQKKLNSQKDTFLTDGYPDQLYTVEMDENFESVALVQGKKYPLPVLNTAKIQGYIEPWKGQGYRLTEKGKSYVERRKKNITD